ncbi:phage tail tape measure protein [Salmonella enterica subsp. enterica]|uniref:Phage tail tape measure protein n=1 Tax=Salmonella typhimurium TaxID=90371 RepID=A0A3U0CJF4_SALTM|nr:phage tail tape measure protein [Salmonella enterica]EAA0800722.1 phage tail tape measure protein [Salmonella enterica subsp. enterica serovar Typhimurium]EAA2720187.1 phage tail tape measure protein [Salmonella enterica subsp. enterica serovar Typhimurium]EAY2918117.1 phage tail tape measure protein [Salmonella enterica subsp. enterica serovar Typhimurium]EBG0187228.1 phage tail tape measure protein [Salmonella enterica subsp. enterica serovar Typhimurium]EBG5404118.1 phage tail tape measu
MANDIITQLQARNETLTQAIARYGSLNASTLHTLSFEQTKITRLTQQLANSALRREENDKQRAGLLEKTQTFAGQLGKLLNVETPDWKLPYEFQGNMVDMAAKGGMDNTARDALSLNIRDWSLAFNQDQKDLQSAAATMIEGGVSALQDLSRYMPDIAKAATASRDSAQSWAQAALATRDKLNIAPDDFRFAQNMLYSVAKSGGSVAEQTQWINAFAGKTGAQGKEGIAELTATMQIAMKNAPDAGAAAANFDHFLKSAFSKETDSWFARQGVDLQGSLLEHQQNGIGVTEAMTHIVQMQLEKMNPQILDTFRQTMKIEDLSARGDALQAMTEKFNLGAMFGDAQTRDFLAPMLANMAEYRQLKASAMQAAGQHFIDDDFAAKMTSPGEQTKALQLSLNDLWLTVGLALMAAIGELAQSITPLVRQFSAWLRENPALGGGSRALSVLKSFGNGAKSLTMLLGNGLIKGLRLVGQTFIWLGRALLMNPVGLTITAIAGAAYLLYRYWEPISGFFAGVWERIKTAFDGGIAGVTRLILDWSPLGLFYRAFASVLDWFGIELPASFSEFGGNILDSLINGILNALPFLNGAIEKIKALIPDWAKSALGISTEMPSVAAAVPGIAGTMVAQQASAPLVSGVKAVTTSAKTMASSQSMKTKSAATPPTPAALPGKSGGKPYTLPSRAQSNVQVHFSPQVTVQGSGANAAKDINNVLSLSKRELERMINDVMAQQRRREYA